MNVIAVNPESTIQREAISENQHCVVVDDFLLRPHDVVDFAARHASEFSRQASSYPGQLFRLDADAMSDIYRFIRNRMSKHFPFLRGNMDYWTYLSIVTVKPADLSYLQRICHTDPEADPNRTPYAALIYLFDDEALGGTSFYRWKDLESVQQAEAAGRDNPDQALTLLQEKFPTFREPPRYMTESNEIAELLCTIPARFNRMVFYSGEVPHSGAIVAPELLSTNVRRGRLTLNAYISAVPNRANSLSH
jgi:hypothetical protein